MNFWGGQIIHIQPTFHYGSWLRRLSKHSTSPHFSRCGGIQSMPGGLKLYNGVGIFIQIIPQAAALVFVFSVSAWHFSLSSRNSTGCWTKTITADRQRVKDRETERERGRKKSTEKMTHNRLLGAVWLRLIPPLSPPPQMTGQWPLHLELELAAPGSRTSGEQASSRMC